MVSPSSSPSSFARTIGKDTLLAGRCSMLSHAGGIGELAARVPRSAGSLDWVVFVIGVAWRWVVRSSWRLALHHPAKRCYDAVKLVGC